jgi:hypothetical protein
LPLLIFAFFIVFQGFSLCVFFLLYIPRDTHILIPTHVVSFAFDHFASKLAFVGLFVQPHKCLVWAPFSLPHGFVLLVELCCPLGGIKILGVPFGFAFFAFSFL